MPDQDVPIDVRPGDIGRLVYDKERRTIVKESRTVHDPFLNKDVQVSSRLTDRLRGRYASGPTMANGEPEFGWREFQTPPVQHEAAAEIERLQAIEKAAWDYFNHAVQDEADDRENCVSDEHHRLAYELKNALDFDSRQR